MGERISNLSKSIFPAAAAGLAFVTMCGGGAAQAQEAESGEAGRLRAAMESARWTGPLLASNAETLPQGHVYTEPYLFDSISGGEHSPGTSGFYQYGLLNNLTVGVQPNIAFGTDSANRGASIGDFKLLSQVRLTHFTPNHRVPTIALMFNLAIPTGKYDRLGELKHGHGSGSFAPEAGLNVQHYFLLKNDRLLRARINLLKSFPMRSHIDGRSVFGTGPDFHGHAKPGSRTALIGAVEYSLTDEWVLALDVEADFWDKTKVEGNDGGPLVRQTFPSSRNVGFAPAVEYNWSPRTGIILGVWIIPKGHNTPSSVTPAIAFSRFW